jgi:hypothetical protein
MNLPISSQKVVWVIDLAEFILLRVNLLFHSFIYYLCSGCPFLCTVYNIYATFGMLEMLRWNKRKST